MAYLLANHAGSSFAEHVAASLRADGFDSIGFLERHFSRLGSNRICYVVPTGRRVRWLLREITRRVAGATGRPLVGFDVYNLARLGTALHRQLFPDDFTLPLSDGMRLALFEQAIAELTRSSKLPFYAPQGTPNWSIVERLASVVTGLREDGIQPDDLRSDLEYTDEPFAIDRARLGDILALYERYLSLLNGRYHDETTIYERVSDALLNEQRSIDFPPILIEGFSEFRVPEIRFLGALATATFPVCIMLDYSHVNGPLFGNLQSTFDTLCTLGFTAQAFDPPLEQQALSFRPRTAYLQRWLFNTEQEIRNSDFNDCITTIGCTNRFEEVTLIAKYTKHCLVNLGYKPHQICIAMRDPEEYADLFREVFTIHGIPANISDRFRLDRSPLAVALMSLLAVITRGWRREDVHRALSNPLVRIKRADGTLIDATTINNVAERQRITGGHLNGGIEGWISRLERALENARAYSQSLNDDPYADPNDRRNAEQDCTHIARALDDIRHLSTILQCDQTQITAQEFCTYVRKVLLEGTGIAESIEDSFECSWSRSKRSPEDIVYLELLEQETRAYAAILDVLSEIEYAWSQEEQQRHTVTEFTELLETMIRATRYQIAEKPSYGVTITSVEQTRGIPYDVFILCGMVDGEFPRAYSTEYFLGKELPHSEERHIRAERIQFYDALTNNPIALEKGSWRMLITYPRMTSTGEQLVRSSFIDKLFKITTLQERCFQSHTLVAAYRRDPEQCKEFAWITAITAPEELQQRRGSEHTNAQWSLQHTITLDTEAQAAIARLLDDPFSVTEFERYAQCPYQYFAKHILQLREPDDQQFGLKALDVGSVLHRILYRFYRTILDQEGSQIGQFRTVRLNPTAYNRYRQMLIEVATVEFERLRYSHPLFALETELLLGTTNLRGLLEQWLDRELERYANGWEYDPALFELEFGMHSHYGEQLQPPVELSHSIRLRGKIDRIELARRGNRWHVLIADYKRRELNVTNKLIKDGYHFQMPLYMLAARTILHEYLGDEPVLDGGIYYILQPKEEDAIPLAMPCDANQFARSQSNKSSRVVANHEELTSLLDLALQHAERIVTQIRGGQFPVMPRDSEVCKNCAYSSVCRIRQLRDDGLTASPETEELDA
jgi:ATP-dependent helicase/nuclease subunit B